MTWVWRFVHWLFRTDMERIEHTEWYLIRYGRNRR